MGEGEAAGVPDFTDREAVEAWLRTQPREVAVVLAERAALRVLPVLSRLSDSMPLLFASTVLVSFRATATAALAIRFQCGSADFGEAVEAAAATADVAHSDDAAAAAAFAAAAAVRDGLYTSAEAAARAIEYSIVAARFGRADVSDRTRAKHTARCTAVDAEAVTNGLSPVFVRRSPLWRDVSAQSWADEDWSRLRDVLDPAEGWKVWIDWYEARRRGAIYDEKLQECYVLIPDEFWAQGPAVTNAEIERRIAAFFERSKDVPPADATPSMEIDMASLLAAPNTQVSLADFAFDELTKLMRMVPFAGDLAVEIDRAELSAQLCAAASAARRLSAALSRKSNNMTLKEFLETLDSYAEEAIVDPERLLPPQLWMLGADLNDWKLDDDLQAQLVPRHRGQLDRLVDLHLQIMRLFFASALARMRKAEAMRLRPDVAPSDLVGPLSGILAALDGDWAQAPGLRPEDRAVFASMVEELRRLYVRLETTASPERREELAQEIEKKGKVAASTAARFGVRSIEAFDKTLDRAVKAKQLAPEGFAYWMEQLGALFQQGWEWFR